MNKKGRKRLTESVSTSFWVHAAPKSWSTYTTDVNKLSMANLHFLKNYKSVTLNMSRLRISYTFDRFVIQCLFFYLLLNITRQHFFQNLFQSFLAYINVVDFYQLLMIAQPKSGKINYFWHFHLIHIIFPSKQCSNGQIIDLTTNYVC